MSFVTRLRPELIAIAPPWHGFRDTAAGLVGMLVGAKAIPAAQEPDAVRAVIAREHEASTAVLETGVGVPHARLGGLRETVVSLAVSRAGLYEPVPTVGIPIVALVLSPPGRATITSGRWRGSRRCCARRSSARLCSARRTRRPRSRPSITTRARRLPRDRATFVVSCRGALQPVAWRRGLDEPSRDRLDRARAAA